jgi:acyl carrier protein
MNKIIDDLRDFLTKNRLVRRGQAVSDDQSLLGSGIIDSLAVLEISTYITQAYDVQIDEDDLVPENFDSLAAMRSYIERKRNVRG